MATVKSWIKAARLRTLPLAFSGILMGMALAYFDGGFNLLVSLLAIVTALCIQVFSNFANDFGDFQKGTDNEFRLGPERTMQGGKINRSEMKAGLWGVGLICLFIGIWLVFEGTKGMDKIFFFIFIGLGLLALLAAYFYTAGKRSYGYVGLGDLAVFLFFGLLPVLGTYFLNSQSFKSLILLPAISIGFFSTGVLNLNNIRDIENDRRSGKNTLASRMGNRNARIYHMFLICWGWIASVIFATNHFYSIWQWLFILSAPLFIFDLVRIFKTENAAKLDPFLKKLSISTLLFTVLFGVGILLSV